VEFTGTNYKAFVAHQPHHHQQQHDVGVVNVSQFLSNRNLNCAATFWQKEAASLTTTTTKTTRKGQQ